MGPKRLEDWQEAIETIIIYNEGHSYQCLVLGSKPIFQIVIVSKDEELTFEVVFLVE